MPWKKKYSLVQREQEESDLGNRKAAEEKS